MPPPPPAYQGGPASNTGKPTNNSLCIASLVCGVVGLILCCIPIFSIAAVILGVIGRKQVNESGGRQIGAGLALAGIILGGLALLAFVGMLANGNSTYRFSPR